jgi:hypothetical protein
MSNKKPKVDPLTQAGKLTPEELATSVKSSDLAKLITTPKSDRGTIADVRINSRGRLQQNAELDARLATAFAKDARNSETGLTTPEQAREIGQAALSQLKPNTVFDVRGLEPQATIPGVEPAPERPATFPGAAMTGERLYDLWTNVGMVQGLAGMRRWDELEERGRISWRLMAECLNEWAGLNDGE